MTDENVFPVPDAIAKSAWINNEQYLEMYKRSVEDSAGFWAEHAKRIDWIKPFTQVRDIDLNVPNVHIRWFPDGTLNVSANCLDRHLATRGDQTALIFEGDNPATRTTSPIGNCMRRCANSPTS